MILDHQVKQALRHVADGVVAPEVDLDAVRSQGHRNRRRSVSVAVVAAVVAVMLAGAVLVIVRDVGGPAPVDPVKPGLVVGDVPVWYDAAGLHRGDVTEQTPVHMTDPGVLALVRDGALYTYVESGVVWYHPWGGDPRVIGRSRNGASGDPNSSIAAWFEGDELVVYDTAGGHELSRTEESPARPYGREHVGSGNGIMHVSTEEVVWRSNADVHRLDVRTGTSAVLSKQVWAPVDMQDVHGTTRVWGAFQGTPEEPYALSFEVAGRERALPKTFEPIGRLSADGTYMLSPTSSDGHGAAVVDMRSGDTWELPPDDFYGWISWSYGDIATVVVDRGINGNGSTPMLLACDAGTRSCDRLRLDGDFVLPNS